jgi:septum site-determining protein MinC
MQPQSENWADILEDLHLFFHNAGNFFHGGRVILELLETQDLDKTTFTQLRDVLEEHEMQLWAVVGGNVETQRLIREQGLRTRLPDNEAEREPDPQSNALFIKKTIRSGQRINAPGHVTVLGDINPGGEIIAVGNIVVWGHVRGIVHAGALGDRDAMICALALEPAQLRIADLITRSPEDEQSHPAQPETARIQDDVIIVEPWSVRGGQIGW